MTGVLLAATPAAARNAEPPPLTPPVVPLPPLELPPIALPELDGVGRLDARDATFAAAPVDADVLEFR